ncbi:lysozyme [Tritonibacter mobilis]|uniref:Lysozyme n=1 Tax=Tritonibacter mobilis F1926 TaxID=1265309 RepID=A0A1B1A8J5_9RHOB|nr:lysozyme [Tritonibacter mobilis]ANP42899.1 lysozyme [Tritonibacter mobilis F1926]KJZ23277.1 lysozyme [Tritonibacter mobilis]
MKLVENWRSVLGGAWSVRLMLVSAILSALPVFFDLVSANMLGINPMLFAVLASGASALAVVARVFQQAALSGALQKFRSDDGGGVRVRKRTLGIAGMISVVAIAATPIVSKWEGLRTQAYQDVIGVWTVCYGETKGVGPGDAYTVAECEAMLDAELRDYAVGLGKCLKAPLPEGAAAAFLSWSYNVGTSAACRSTAVRKANAGDLFGACDELLRWTRAGGRVVPGLVNRRRDEHALCVGSLVAAGLSR